ncbi:MAG: hypothetical protein V3T98_00090 [Candidatus Paceibacterota bacterium]
MNEQNQNDFNLESGGVGEPKTKSKYWKFVVAFLVIILVVVGGYFVWNKYFSPQAISNRETQKNYEKYLEWEKNYEKAMREDVYGGKTPQETLDLFVEALRAEDIELASKYLALNTNENSEYYLTRRELEEALKRTKEEGKLLDVIEIVSNTEFDSDSSSNNTAWFILKNKEGLVEYSVILKFNKYSNVWKIESL